MLPVLPLHGTATELNTETGVTIPRLMHNAKGSQECTSHAKFYHSQSFWRPIATTNIGPTWVMANMPFDGLQKATSAYHASLMTSLQQLHMKVQALLMLTRIVAD